MTGRPESIKDPTVTALVLKGRPPIASLVGAYRAQLPFMSPMDRWDRLSQFRGWLQQDGLPNLSTEQAHILYSASGGRKMKEFKTNTVDEIRDSIDFLLYDPLSLDGRFSECVDPEGAYTLKGSGKGFVSYLLCVCYPQLFGHWSSYSDRSLSLLGIARPKARKLVQGQGTTYVQYLDLLWSVRRAAGMADFPELDRFLWWLAKKGKEGNPSRNGVPAPINGQDPETKIPTK